MFRFSSDFFFHFAAFIQSESELRYLVDDGVDVPFISEVSLIRFFTPPLKSDFQKCLELSSNFQSSKVLSLHRKIVKNVQNGLSTKL